MNDIELYTTVLKMVLKASVKKIDVDNLTALTPYVNCVPTSVTIDPFSEIGRVDRTTLDVDRLTELTNDLTLGAVSLVEMIGEYSNSYFSTLLDSVKNMLARIANDAETEAGVVNIPFTLTPFELGIFDANNPQLIDLFDFVKETDPLTQQASYTYIDYINKGLVYLERDPVVSSAIEKLLIQQNIQNRMIIAWLVDDYEIKNITTRYGVLSNADSCKDVLQIMTSLSQAYAVLQNLKSQTLPEDIITFLNKRTLLLNYFILGFYTLFNSKFKSVLIYYISGTGEVVYNSDSVIEFNTKANVTFNEYAKMLTYNKWTPAKNDSLLVIQDMITVQQAINGISITIGTYTTNMNALIEKNKVHQQNRLIQALKSVLNNFLLDKGMPQDEIDEKERYISDFASMLVGDNGVAIGEIVLEFVIKFIPPTNPYVLHMYTTVLQYCRTNKVDFGNTGITPFIVGVVSTIVKFINSTEIGIVSDISYDDQIVKQ